MAFAAAIVPYLSAAAAAYQGVRQSQASQFNAQVMSNTQKTAVDQANAQEGMVRRASRESLGREAAAFGGAGVGYGGSSATALDQSAVNQELDALNTRYKGAAAGYGYGVQSQILQKEASEQQTAGFLLAGGQALKAFGGNYAGLPTPTSQAGLTVPGGPGGGPGP